MEAQEETLARRALQSGDHRTLQALARRASVTYHDLARLATEFPRQARPTNDGRLVLGVDCDVVEMPDGRAVVRKRW